MPIGQFARASRLSVKALRNYDASGLLPAAFVDDQSGYRYYRVEQLAPAALIRSLRLLDVPLATITAILAEGASEGQLTTHLAGLIRQRDVIDRQVREIRRLIRTKELTMATDITIKTVEPVTAAAVRATTSPSDVFTEIPAGFATVMAALGLVTPVGAPLTIFYRFPDEQTAGEIAMCVPVPSQAALSEPLERLELPGGAVASIVHTGSYREMAVAYTGIAEWIHERGHEIAGPVREIYLNNPADVPENELMTEIQWPIDGQDG